MSGRPGAGLMRSSHFMDRVLVLGGCGAGKSVFARRLGASIDAPVIHLDAEYFQPGWIEPEPAAWHARLMEMVRAPRWVMDGHNNTLALRLPYADTAIVLDLPTWLCLARVLLRIARNYGRVRADMAPGCPERLDPEFILYAARYRKDINQRMFAQLEAFSGQVVVLRSRREIEAFLSARADPARRSVRKAAM
jgi:adenylate kinase family enzyme